MRELRLVSWLVCFILLAVGCSRAAPAGGVRIDVKDGDLRSTLRQIAEVAGVHIEMDPSVKGRVTFKTQGVDWETSLKSLAAQAGLGYRSLEKVTEVHHGGKTKRKKFPMIFVWHQSSAPAFSGVLRKGDALKPREDRLTTPEQPEVKAAAAGTDASKEKETGTATTLTGPAPVAGTGSITGSVAFTGTPPEMPLLDRKVDAFCVKTPTREQEVMVNPNKTLKNVVVRVTAGVASDYPAPATSMEVRQSNCMYAPRVQAGVLGQTVKIFNDDPTLHNVHTVKGTATWFNLAQPLVKGVPPITKKLENGVGMITFKCDVHPWMRGYISVTKHPFFAVTGDDGSFKISAMPAGTYTIEAWHEKLGAKTAQVKVDDNKASEANFSFGP